MRLNKYLGYRIQFNSGVSVGWSWVHGNGASSKRSAVLASYHNPKSITWRWALYYHLPNIDAGWRSLLPCLDRGRNCCGIGFGPLGYFWLCWQDHMFRAQP